MDRGRLVACSLEAYSPQRVDAGVWGFPGTKTGTRARPRVVMGLLPQDTGHPPVYDWLLL